MYQYDPVNHRCGLNSLRKRTRRSPPNRNMPLSLNLAIGPSDSTRLLLCLNTRSGALVRWDRDKGEPGISSLNCINTDFQYDQENIARLWPNCASPRLAHPRSVQKRRGVLRSSEWLSLAIVRAKCRQYGFEAHRYSRCRRRGDVLPRRT